MVDKHGKSGDGNYQKLNTESVMVTVVRRTEFLVHEKNRRIRRENENDFHHRVVDGDERCEEVKISR